jgi:hypothetical protein
MNGLKVENPNKKCKNCDEDWLEKQQRCWKCKSWDYIAKDQYDILVSEIRNTLELWDKGLLEKYNLFQMISGAISRCREANWTDGLGPNAFRKT